MANSSSSSSKSSISPRHPPLFTPIEEGNEEEEYSQGRNSFRAETTPSEVEYRHHPTPLHQHSNNTENKGKGCTKKRPENGEDDRGVLCNKCRPSNRERITHVVPLDNKNNSITSPHGIFKSVLSTLVKKSPRLSSSSDVESSTGGSREEQWKIAVAELSHKLIQATRKRDEAILEASRLKFSMVELEKKLNKLEIYCHSLKSGLEVCSNNVNSQHQITKSPHLQRVKFGEEDKVIEHFLVMVSEARSSVRNLSRSMTFQLRQIGGKVYDRIALLLQPYDIKVSISRNPRGLIVYLEALLNKAFYEDFESIGFQKGSCNQILNPIDRCEANFGLYNRLKDLTWEEVLSKGTRFYSEEFSKFCDRKMSEIVAMLGWNRAWPEPLLQAFFGASKAVWLVHLLANSLHPGLPIFRVDKEMKFDSVYMEDMGGDKAKKLVPAMVRIMVTPGFYVYDNVVKCKVLSRYNNSINNISFDGNEKGLTPSPT
ncbi:PREDICTED: IRK-interacting protein [Nicotiana attenuata]|uniref:Irk-interacting protein n=1 Tax=Nicotiana attenuata TaxID=49451 RepID=A0A1J6I540_NICAT|nr:PREDICTED: IRK-interacting protein [Nicotiana attenuata]OIS99595.1 irk-interacting protein [Nicotiana attenuata]